jgi:hypothetical protein
MAKALKLSAEQAAQIDVATGLICGFRMYLAGAVERSRADYPELQDGIEAIVVDSRSMDSWLHALDEAATSLMKAGLPPLLAHGVTPPPPVRPRPRRPVLRVVEGDRR